MRYVGEGRQAYFGDTRPTSPYRLFDMYAEYRHSQRLTVFWSAENITDKAFSIAGGGLGELNRENGRGRTHVLGVNIHF